MSSLREQFNVEADAIPALGDVDAALAQVAREHRNWRRAGIAAAATAAAVALLALGVRPYLSAHDPAGGPADTPSPSASPLSVGEPVVRGDSAHHRSYVIFMLRNTSARPVAITFTSLGGNGSGGSASNLVVDNKILTAAAGDQLVSAPVAARYAIANSLTNELPHGAARINAGDRAAFVLIVSYPCTATPPPWRGTAGAELEGPGLGPHSGQVLVDFSSPTTPAWLTAALHEACHA